MIGADLNGVAMEKILVRPNVRIQRRSSKAALYNRMSKNAIQSSIEQDK
jgi:hypothetical protein